MLLEPPGTPSTHPSAYGPSANQGQLFTPPSRAAGGSRNAASINFDLADPSPATSPLKWLPGVTLRTLGRRPGHVRAPNCAGCRQGDWSARPAASDAWHGEGGRGKPTRSATPAFWRARSNLPGGAEVAWPRGLFIPSLHPLASFRLDPAARGDPTETRTCPAQLRSGSRSSE